MKFMKMVVLLALIIGNITVSSDMKVAPCNDNPITWKTCATVGTVLGATVIVSKILYDVYRRHTRSKNFLKRKNNHSLVKKSNTSASDLYCDLNNPLKKRGSSLGSDSDREQVLKKYEQRGLEFRQALLKHPKTPWWSKLWMQYFPAHIQISNEKQTKWSGNCRFNTITIADYISRESEASQRRALAHEYIHYAQSHTLSGLFKCLPISIFLSTSCVILDEGRKEKRSLRYFFPIIFSANIALMYGIQSLFIYNNELEAESLSCSRFKNIRGYSPNELLKTTIVKNAYGSALHNQPCTLSEKITAYSSFFRYPTAYAFLQKTLEVAQKDYYDQLCQKNPHLSKTILRQKTVEWIETIIIEATKNQGLSKDTIEKILHLGQATKPL